MRTVITVTLNPAIDRTVWIERLVPGDTHRTAMTRAAIGGKGINVARTAARLGACVGALGIAGEDQAAAIERHLEALGIDARFLATAGETRTNLKLIEQADGRMTEVNGVGSEVSSALLDQLAGELRDRIAREPDAIVVLAGSLPAGVPAGIYATWTADLRRTAPDATVVVDASDAPLACAIDAAPFLVKPNRVEAESLLGRLIDGRRSAEAAALQLAARGPRAVLLSLGADGAVAAIDDRAESLPARAIEVAGPMVSTVGAGDAMVARIAYELSKTDQTSLSPASFFGICRLAVDQAAEAITGG